MKGDAEGKMERMDMMVPETLSERWTNISLVARKEERILYKGFGSIQVLPSCRLTHSCFNENTTLIYFPLTEIGSVRYVCTRQPSTVQRTPVKGASR